MIRHIHAAQQLLELHILTNSSRGGHKPLDGTRSVLRVDEMHTHGLRVVPNHGEFCWHNSEGTRLIQLIAVLAYRQSDTRVIFLHDLENHTYAIAGIEHQRLPIFVLEPGRRGTVELGKTVINRLADRRKRIESHFQLHEVGIGKVVHTALQGGLRH
jgi:hypothetical protein